MKYERYNKKQLIEIIECLNHNLDDADTRINNQYGLLKNLCDKANKYRWHDLRKNPDDLPKDGERILFYTIYFEDGHEPRYWTGEFVECVLYESYFRNDDAEAYATRGTYGVKEVIAWRYIEPYEVEE